MLVYLTTTALKKTAAQPLLTLLMALAIGLGIGFFMTILTVGYSMGKNPLPHKNDVLYAVQLDSGDPSVVPEDPNDLSDQISYIDAMELMRTGPPHRRIATAGTLVVIVPSQPTLRPFRTPGRGTFNDFFSMFDVPFEYGASWSKDDDDSGKQVAVISHPLNDKLFGGTNSVGQTITVGRDQFVISGVLKPWRLTPRFYDLSGGPFSSPADLFLPFNTMVEREYSRRGNVSCWKPYDGGFDAFLASECVWIQFWVELLDESERANYLNFLNNHVTEQKRLGRFGRPTNNHLRNIGEWLDYNNVVDDGVWTIATIAFLFLIVCLINTLGLMLAKFLARSKENAIRRALGSSRQIMFVQHLIESALIGIVGGIVGIVFSWFGLLGIRTLFDDPDIVLLTSLDLTMLATALAIALSVSILTGVYPTLRACRIEPVTYLKT